MYLHTGELDACIVGGKRPSYVNSQALGMVENDTIEAADHMEIFGESVPITSIKGVTGHTFGASAGMQIISSLIGMERHFIPSTVHAVENDYPGVPIVYRTIQTQVDSFIVTSHGYGGNNACIFISRYER